MRALFLSHCFPSWDGDNKGQMVKTYAEGLTTLGVEVVVVYPQVAPSPDHDPLQIPEGIHLVPFAVRESERDLKGIASNPIGLLRYLRRFKRTAAKAIRDFHPDLIHSFWTLPGGVIGSSLARRHRLPHVTHCMGSDLKVFAPKYAATRWITGRALRRADAVAGVSRDLLTCAQRDHGVDAARCHHICTGVNSDLFHPIPREDAERELGIATEGPRILFVGELTAVKGIDTLIRAIGDLKSKGASLTLHLVGTGDQREELESLIEELGLKACVKFEGRQPHRRIALWMNACDVLALPSLSEGTPNVVMEALCCGTPVVATEVGGIPEIIADISPGALFAPRDVVALTKALASEFESHSLLDAVRQHLDQSVERFSIATTCAQIADLYRALGAQ